jgi:flagellar biosynthesis protein FliP
MPTLLRRTLCVAALALALIAGFDAAPAGAQTPVTVPAVEAPAVGGDGRPEASINLDLGPSEDGSIPSQSIVIIMMLTLLSVAPALLMMLTSFTRIVVVLSLTRNALGLQSIPPNQVVIGLALFLSLFMMAPTLKTLNDEALQPFLKGQLEQGEALKTAEAPIKEFMLDQTREGELSLFIRAAGDEKPANEEDVSMTALVPAYILSELKTAFIIGFIIFVPFLVIDLVVSSSLMSMGMMMLPPVLISLPFKLLLFVMVDGWALVVRALISSFN